MSLPWRLLALALFLAIIIPLGFAWRWIIDNVLPIEAVYFGAGIFFGLGLGMLIQRREMTARARRAGRAAARFRR